MGKLRIKDHTRFFGLIAWVIAWVLTGCSGSQATPQSTPLVSLPQPTSTQSLLATPTVEQIDTPAATKTVEDTGLPPIPSGCTVVSKRFSSEPEEQSTFPAASETDWSLGPEDASVTIIEYGDFQ